MDNHLSIKDCRDRAVVIVDDETMRLDTVVPQSRKFGKSIPYLKQFMREYRIEIPEDVVDSLFAPIFDEYVVDLRDDPDPDYCSDGVNKDLSDRGFAVYDVMKRLDKPLIAKVFHEILCFDMLDMLFPERHNNAPDNQDYYSQLRYILNSVDDVSFSDDRVTISGRCIPWSEWRNPDHYRNVEREAAAVNNPRRSVSCFERILLFLHMR